MHVLHYPSPDGIGNGNGKRSGPAVCCDGWLIKSLHLTPPNPSPTHVPLHSISCPDRACCRWWRWMPAPGWQKTMKAECGEGLAHHCWSEGWWVVAGGFQLTCNWMAQGEESSLSHLTSLCDQLLVTRECSLVSGKAALYSPV